MNCTDGVLLLADTEETTSIGTKSEADKLYRFFFPAGIVAAGGTDRMYRLIVPAGIVAAGGASGTVVMGGAGDSHFIECANQELQEFLGKGFKQGENIKAKLNDFARMFFRATVGEYRGFAAEIIRDLEMEMLIAISSAGQTWLFRWQRDRVKLEPKLGHTSIGCGMIQMHPMLRELQFSFTCEAMLFHGIRIMLQTKKTVQGVGGRTEAIALLNDGATQFFPPRVTRLVEELVEDIEKYNIHIVNRLVCEPMSNAEWGESALGKLPDDIRKFRDRYMKIFKPSTGRTSGDQQ
jgi:hypothetical protein